MPACHTKRELHCVVAYSVFNQTPPDNALFGRANGRFEQSFGLPARTDVEVLCNNPAGAREAGSPRSATFAPTSPFPGTLGLGIQLLFNGAPPTAPTPWIQPQDHYLAHCVQSNGANVLDDLAGRLGPHADAQSPTRAGACTSPTSTSRSATWSTWCARSRALT